jgi:hypothetical protein
VQAPSEGTAFTQKGKKKDKKNKGEGKSSDKKEAGDGNKDGNKQDYFSDKTCYLCGKTGHGVKKCPKRSTKDDNDASISSKSSKSNSSANKSIEQLEKNLSKQFSQLKTQIEEDKDLSDDEEHSHVQFTAVSQLIERVSLKQSKGKLRDLDLRKVVLLDNQSTVSLFCNKEMVTNIRKAKRPMKLKSNGGSMGAHKIADIGEDQSVWFSDEAIANILSPIDAIALY